ncbi:YesL family protein [Amphibacillus marinus]|nr:YesL family protein [Amphibacillus marinus]
MENNNGFISTRFYQVTIWIWKMAYLHLLWLGFSIAGLGLITLFPATAALYGVLRKWLMNEQELNIFQVFFKVFKESLLKANLLGYTVCFFGYLIWFNYHYLGVISGLEYLSIVILWYVLVIVFMFMALFLLPLYVHYQMTYFNYLKASIIIALLNPIKVLSLIITLLLAGAAFYLLPGLIPFYLSSVIGWLVMWHALRAFKKLDTKRLQLAQQDIDKAKKGKLSESLNSSTYPM